ncbi:MAG TPA: transporter [Stellaceae bacterium]|nr:transporter [Stellaceae bacterium]
MLSLRSYKSKVPGLNDLLNWAALIDDGVVQAKDGSLLAAWFYRGPDIASSTDNERNSLTERINRALSRLRGGWSLWVNAARIDAAAYPPASASDFPDSISRLVDEERREAFEREGGHYESEYSIVLSYTPPLRRNSRIEDLIYDKSSIEQVSPAARILDQFKKDLDQIEDAIGDAVHLRRMRSFTITDPDGSQHHSDELINHLNFCLTGEMLALKIPATGIYLDALLGLQELWKGETPMLGEKYIACVSIQGYPEESFPQILDALDHFEFSYRWSTRFIVMDQRESISELQKYHRKWKQKVRGFLAQMFKSSGGTINEDALLMTQQAQSALAAANSSQVAYGYLTNTIVLMDADHAALIENARAAVREIQRAGFAARIETQNTMAAWHGSLPGHALPNVRRAPEHTDNLANLLPLSSVWAGELVHPNRYYPPNSPPLMYAATTGAAPFRISLHSEDLGHTLIFGPSKAGKSTLLATTILSARRYPDATIVAFDRDYSLKAVALACGGRHYDIAGDSTPSFCPLSVLESEVDLAWAEEWIAICMELQTGKLPLPEQRDAIHRAMLLLRESDMRSLTHFVAYVQDEAVRTAMQFYIGTGTVGYLLDAETDGVADTRLMVFEIGQLMGLGEAAYIPVLLYLFRRLERRLLGQPGFILLDEAWTVLDSPVFRRRLREWLKAMRKKVCSVILATQSLGDVLNTDIIETLVENCPTKIFLPNPEAETTGTPTNPGPHDRYAALGLNDRQVGIIKSATPKRHYYLTSPEGCRLFDLGLGPIALAFAGVSDPKAVAHIDELARQYGDDWPFTYLAEKGITNEHPYRAAAE